MNRWLSMLVVGAVALLSGCGGGGDAPSSAQSSPPTQPSLSLTPQSVKALRFDWADVSGESEYRLLENPDGISGYSQVAIIPADSSSHDHLVFLPGRINARYILQACNAAGCTDSAAVFVSGSLAEAVGYVKASNTGLRDGFGVSVALAADGNTLAVGAEFEDSAATGIDGNQVDDCGEETPVNCAAGSGAVYVFTRSGSTWSQQAYLKASNTGAGDRFGSSVALAADGSTLAVGAESEDGVDDTAGNSGAVYVFTRSGSAWSEQADLKASNAEAGDLLGRSVALAADGSTLAVGAGGEDSAGINSGAVYVFTRSGSAWSEQADLKASNAEAGDFFGYSVALDGDGNTLAVGAEFGAADSGAVYVFTRSGSAWSEQADLKASNAEADDGFGESVALSADGNTLAVGASREGSPATGIDGAQEDDCLEATPVNCARFSGAVYVFTRSDSTWIQEAYLKASNTEADDAFGRSVALAADGNTLAVGAAGEASAANGINGAGDDTASESGAVYIFTRGGAGNWSQQAYVKASNTDAFDLFGSRVALAADGHTLAVGADGEDSAATGIGGDQVDDCGVATPINCAVNSGSVYLY